MQLIRATCPTSPHKKALSLPALSLPRVLLTWERCSAVRWRCLCSGMAGNEFTSDDLMKQAMHTWQCILVMQLFYILQLDQWTFCSHWLHQHFLASITDYSQTVETQAGEVECEVSEKFTRFLSSEDSHQR